MAGNLEKVAWSAAAGLPAWGRDLSIYRAGISSIYGLELTIFCLGCDHQWGSAFDQKFY